MCKQEGRPPGTAQYGMLSRHGTVAGIQYYVAVLLVYSLYSWNPIMMI